MTAPGHARWARRLAVPTGLLLVVASAGVRWIPATRVRTHLRRMARVVVRVTPGPVDGPVVRGAVRRADGAMPGHRSCLAKSLVAAALLEAAGRDATVRLGVARPGEGFRAHSWVESDGVVVVGDDYRLEQYEPLGTLADVDTADYEFV